VKDIHLAKSCETLVFPDPESPDISKNLLALSAEIIRKSSGNGNRAISAKSQTCIWPKCIVLNKNRKAIGGGL
jgi:hypothetical protein